MTDARDFNRELYPFLYADESSAGESWDAVLADARDSTLQKCADVMTLRRQLRDEFADQLVEASMAMAEAFARGGKLLAFGNGGSATDAQDAAVDCLSPPAAFPDWRPLPAIALSNDIGVVTGIANDVGFDSVFSRQLMALGESSDIAFGFSTSGSSSNIIAAFREARKRGMLCIALTGNDGGLLVSPGLVDFSFVGRLEYIPRIQEGHATVWHSLLELTQACLAEGASAVIGT
ncbi:MAG: SIS domain-containing protein [Gemmatimonadaceae bacterium]